MSNKILPWMTDSEITLFKTFLNKTNIYFEYGCGGSTILASSYNNISKIYTVESDSEWLNKIQNTSTKIIPLHIDLGKTKSLGYPVSKNKTTNWTNYSSIIQNISEVPDLILIDGRFRVACGIQSFIKIQNTNSIVLIHDYQREHYHILNDLYSTIEYSEKLFALKPKVDINEKKIINVYEKYKYDAR